MGIENFERPISQNHTSREMAYSLIHEWLYLKKQKYELDFGIKFKLKVSFSLQWYQKKTHFTQNVTCSLSASQMS